MNKIVVSLFLTVIIVGHSYSQGHYVIVVGAFAPGKVSYAENFRKSLGMETVLVQDTKRNLLLVGIEEFSVRKPSIDRMLEVRKEGKFPEAWVRVLGPEAQVVSEPAKPVKEELPVATVQPPPPQQTPPPQTTEDETRSARPGFTEIKEPDTVTIKSEPVTISIPEAPRETKAPKGPPTPANTPVVFHMYDANDNSKIIEGNVEIVDTQRARLIQSRKSTDTVSLPNPNSDSNMLSLITDVFGYRRLQHEVSYKQPIADSSKHYFDLEGDHYVAHFEMVRYHKGDIATLYHVYFYNDAAIMMPESKYELNKLLDMMQSNKKYRIRLHGHTNGNNHGRIIAMGPSKEFFSVNASDVKNGSGSSKELSGQRAEVIKEWLMAQGIAGDRIEVKAWGGKRMIHDKNSNNARKNVRVEVEVLEE